MVIYRNGPVTITENYKDIIDIQKLEGDDKFFHLHLRPAKGQYSNDPHSGIYIIIGNPTDYIVYRNITYSGSDLKKLFMIIKNRNLEKEIDSIL